MVKIWPTLEPPVPRKAMPRHVAIIMDGNGRWARSRGLLRVRGHEAGVESVRDTVRYSGQVHLTALTLYAFSTENWKRPRDEVRFLMRLLKRYLVEELEELHANGVKLTSIGRIRELPVDVYECLDQAQVRTAGNRGLNLCLALNYGARDEIVDAARSLAEEVAQGKLTPEEISAEILEGHLRTAGMPALDLLIRTAGEQRVSNFMLWQIGSSEFHVAEACWPDFRRAHLQTALEAFASQRQPHPANQHFSVNRLNPE